MSTTEMAGPGGPPGLGGFGEVGEAAVWLQTIAKTMKPLGEIRDNVEADSVDVEHYVKGLAVVTTDLTKACRRMFEQEHLRFINMFAAA